MFFFFFKQKTAYEMLISDWSSDVCSSDLEYTLMQSFGFEGGLRKDSGKNSTAYGGILQDTLDKAKAAGVPGLEHVDRPDGLGFDQQIGRASCRERVCQYV